MELTKTQIAQVATETLTENEIMKVFLSSLFDTTRSVEDVEWAKTNIQLKIGLTITGIDS